MTSYNVGKVIKIIWDEENNSLQVVMDITDPVFKNHILHTKEFNDIISFSGKDVMVIASNSKKEE